MRSLARPLVAAVLAGTGLLAVPPASADKCLVLGANAYCIPCLPQGLTEVNQVQSVLDELPGGGGTPQQLGEIGEIGECRAR